MSGVRSVWTAGHMATCKQFATGWLCDVTCPVPADECVARVPSTSEGEET